MLVSASRILVVRAGALGDTLMATPVLRALRRRHPVAAIDLLCSAGAVPLVALNPHVARVIAIARRNVPYSLSQEKQALVRDLRASGYDLAVVLERAPRYADLVRRAGIPVQLGFARTPFDPTLHSSVNNLRAAGFDPSPDMLEMDLPISAEDRQFVEALLGPDPEPLVGVHAGYGPASRKRNQEARLRGWSVANFVAVGRVLIDRGLRLVLTGSAEDRPIASRIAQALPPGRVLQLAGRTTVGQLAAVIARLPLFIAVDSGPAHMAAAVGTPLVVLWGPGILEQTRPLSSRSAVRIVRNPVFCAPCYGTPSMRTCTRNICMESIAPAHVIGAIDELLPRVIRLPQAEPR